MVATIGLERALTVWNDQLALLPWGLSRILGITVHLGILRRCRRRWPRPVWRSRRPVRCC
ncbi:hypothetical protein ACFQX7_40615 [Luedemannella flava]